MGKIIACVNEKGGVAKTTTIKNVSVGLAIKGKKVLAIDLDPSANLTKALGMSNVEHGDVYISDIIDKAMRLEDIPEGYGIVQQDEGINIICSSDKLRETEGDLSKAMYREIVLRNYLKTISDKYDYIFLDCPAGLGLLVTNALFASDALLIPVQPHALDVEAMQNLIKTVAMVRKLNGTNKKPEIMGALFTAVRANTKNDIGIMEHLRSSYSQNFPFFNTFIPLASKIPESDLSGKSIYRHAVNSTAALIYNDLIEEFLQIESHGEEENIHGEE